MTEIQETHIFRYFWGSEIVYGGFLLTNWESHKIPAGVGLNIFNSRLPIL